MDDKEIKQQSERYVELLVAYEHYMTAMEEITKKVMETRKELVFLESKLKEQGVKIKNVE
jgi:recombinational DNA repair ATPase RecF